MAVQLKKEKIHYLELQVQVTCFQVVCNGCFKLAIRRDLFLVVGVVQCIICPA